MRSMTRLEAGPEIRMTATAAFPFPLDSAKIVGLSSIRR
jgi:hypothetical protein